MDEVVVGGIGYINWNPSGVVVLDSVVVAKGLLVCSTTTAAGIGGD